MFDVAVRSTGQQVAAGRATSTLPVPPALESLLPDGLRRGSTVTVDGPVSLAFALLGTASGQGAWCALAGFPPISAEAVAGYGIDLSRTVLVPDPGTGWATAVAALLDALDIVVVRPSGRALPPGEVRRLAARARNKGAVFVGCLGGRAWPGADLRLQVAGAEWVGIEAGSGRLRGRQVEVRASGRGRASRPRSAKLWLPACSGGVDAVEPLAPVIELPSAPEPVPVGM